MLDDEERSIRFSADGGVEMSFVPSRSGDDDYEDNDGDRPRPGKKGGKGGKEARRKGVESFGAGMERGGGDPEIAMSEAERKGRTQRRKGMRSGSKNTFRRM